MSQISFYSFSMSGVSQRTVLYLEKHFFSLPLYLEPTSSPVNASYFGSANWLVIKTSAPLQLSGPVLPAIWLFSRVFQHEGSDSRTNKRICMNFHRHCSALLSHGVSLGPSGVGNCCLMLFWAGLTLYVLRNRHRSHVAEVGSF